MRGQTATTFTFTFKSHQEDKEIIVSIIKEYDKAFSASPGWEAPPRPTDESLTKIAQEFSIPALPTLLVELAYEAKYFGVWFAGLGPDFASRTHILQLNEDRRRDGLPSTFVLMTYAFDAVCDCMDIRSSTDPDSFQIIQTQLGDGFFEGYEIFAPNFERYVEKLVELFSERNRQR